MQQTLNRSIPWTVDGRVALAATRALEPIALLAAFTAILMFFRAYAIETAGGSDAYGYVSEAQRLTQGRFYEPERVFSPFGLSEKSSISHPLGYRPPSCLTSNLLQERIVASRKIFSKGWAGAWGGTAKESMPRGFEGGTDGRGNGRRDGSWTSSLRPPGITASTRASC
jgi:hypothetical protein